MIFCCLPGPKEKGTRKEAICILLIFLRFNEHLSTIFLIFCVRSPRVCVCVCTHRRFSFLIFLRWAFDRMANIFYCSFFDVSTNQRESEKRKHQNK